jgi:hypothetical protein
LLPGGCATYADRLAEVRQDFSAGQLKETDDIIQKSMKFRRERDVLKLDQSIVLLASGKPKEAEKNLREIRDHFDHLEQKAVGEKAVSMLTDSTHEAYSGEDYEKVLVRVFLALSNLMTDGADAGAYALQVTDKQQQIIAAGKDKHSDENPKLSYKQVAVGPYLNGALREATHSNFDDVARACTLVCSWQPDFPFGPQDLQRAQSGRHSAPGNGVLYVFGLVGVGPHKEETIEVASSVSLLIADRILSAIGNQDLPPTIAPIKVPKVVIAQNDPGYIGVSINGQPAGRTATITDVGRMAVEQYEAIYPRVIAEAVVRRVVKKAVIYGAMEATGTRKDSLQSIAFDLAGIAWEASESADTRCWGLLPEKIQVLRLELPAGEHQISLTSVGATGYPLGSPSTTGVKISNGRNTYILANFPRNQLVGQILVNQP